MEEPERGLLSCGTSETTVAHDEIVGGETLDGSLECNGKDVIVEGMGSDVYIDGVYVCSSGDEVHDKVGCGDEVKGGEDLSEDVKSVGTETQVEDSKAVEYEEARSENVVVELDSVVSEGEVRDQTVVGSDSCAVVETTPDSIDVVTLEDAARAPDPKVANTSCENQKDRNVIDRGTPGDCNDVTLETLDQHKNMANNLQSDNKILDKGEGVRDSDEIKENLSSNGEQPNGNSKVEDNSDNVQEVVCGTEVAVDKALLNSGEKKSSSVENCNEKEQIIADKDDECVSALDVSDAEQSDVHKVMQIDVENQQGTETVNHTAQVKGTSVSIGSEKNLDANAIVEKDTQITDKRSLVLPLMSDGKEKLKDESNTKQNVEERECISEQVGSNGGHEIEEEFNESGQRKPKDGKVVKHALTKPGSSEICHQARYLLPTVKEEGEFSLSDMVWGKVRSHPWWPGQIFDPSDASERAKKHYKKDCFLVAYFGDRTFAWNEASQLKHFRAHFSSIEKQRSSSESFQNAIDCALDEVSRRIEYGLACSCIPEETYNTIKGQSVENTGIRQEISFKHGDDKSLNASSFSPTNLIDYVKTLSELPTGGFDRLELEIAKAQLLAFNRFKGFSCLPEIQHCGGFDKDNSFVDDEQDVSEIIEDATPVVNKDNQGGLGNLKNKKGARQKRKHNFKDTMHPTKKERRSTDLQSGTPDSPDRDCLSDEMVTDNLVSSEDSKKRRAFDPYDDDPGMQDGRKTTSVAKVSNITKSSFKIGDCIRRAASQLTGSPSLVKCSNDRTQKTDGDIDDFSGNGLDVSPPTSEDAENTTEYSSLNDLLSSLQWVAQEPFGQYTFLNATVSFFSDFRNSIVVAADFRKDVLCTDKVGTKRKKPPVAGTPETFEFEDMSDTYWTDRVIDNGNEEKPVQQPTPTPPPQKKRKKDEKPVTAESAKPAQVTRRPYSRKKQSESNHAEAPGKPPGYIDENAPAELVMNFAELNSVPSETNLNKMFRRFGPLKESETEVDRVSSRARVVFKKCMDAEVACSSAKKFNIFGSVLVNYQLNYTPSALFKAPSVDATTQDQEMLLDLSNFDVNMV